MFYSRWHFFKLPSNISTKCVKRSPYPQYLSDNGVPVKKQAYSWFLLVRDRNLIIRSSCSHLGPISWTLVRQKQGGFKETPSDIKRSLSSSRIAELIFLSVSYFCHFVSSRTTIEQLQVNDQAVKSLRVVQTLQRILKPLQKFLVQTGKERINKEDQPQSYIISNNNKKSSVHVTLMIR